MEMKWGITGAYGFIGTNLRYNLYNKDIEYKILDLLDTPATDIRDYDDCLKFCEDLDVVVHLAANTEVPYSINDPLHDARVNIIGTLNMLNAAVHCGVDKFIFASSGATTGLTSPPISEGTFPCPISPYGASKLAGEHYCFIFSKLYQIDTYCLRFSNVYGPHCKHKNSVVAKFIREALQGNSLKIYGDGNQTRDFIYIDDLLDVMFKLVESDYRHHTFQVATGQETRIQALAEKIALLVSDHTGKVIKINNTEPRVGDIKYNFSDITKIKTLLNWAPTTSLDEGLKNTLTFFLNSDMV